MKKHKTNIDPNTIEYATFNRRLIASTIDLFLLMLILTPISSIINMFEVTKNTQLDKLFLKYQLDNEANYKFNNIFVEGFKSFCNQFEFLYNQGALFYYVITMYLLPAFIMISYVMFFWITKNGTIGKIITKCQILDAKTLAKPSIKQYIIRLFGYMIDFILLGLPFFIIYMNKRRRSLHDILAGTVVIRDKR